MLFAFCLQMLAFDVRAQSRKAERSVEVYDVKEDIQTDFSPKRKIAPDLEEKTEEVFHKMRSDEVQRVIIQLKSETRLNESLGDLSTKERDEMFANEVKSNRNKGGIIIAGLTAAGGRVSKTYNNLGLVSAELPLSQIRDLANSDYIEYISPDRDIQSFQHIGTTTGWYIPGIFDKGDTDSNTWLTGGTGHIAVIDSGIDPQHKLLKWGTATKVKYNKDFTGEGITGDPYGHGSHVASMFAGDQQLNNAAYQGVSPGSNLINLRVLNGLGTGTSSGLIAALDWTVANKTAWNIRVINMSVGTAARDSYTNDPLCLAARRAVNAGIVVVASAGKLRQRSAGK